MMLLMSSTAAEAAFNLNKFESRLRINYRAGIFAVNGGNKRFCGVHFEKHHGMPYSRQKLIAVKSVALRFFVMTSS